MIELCCPALNLGGPFASAATVVAVISLVVYPWRGPAPPLRVLVLGARAPGLRTWSRSLSRRFAQLRQEE